MILNCTNLNVRARAHFLVLERNHVNHPIDFKNTIIIVRFMVAFRIRSLSFRAVKRVFNGLHAYFASEDTSPHLKISLERFKKWILS
jgi:hypothetical protein